MIIFPFIPEKEAPKLTPDIESMPYLPDETDYQSKERSKYQPDLYIPAMAFTTYIL